MATKYVNGSQTGSGHGGTTWADAYTPAEFETYIEGSASAGDIFYWKNDCTLTSAIDSRAIDATATNPISIVGVKTGTTAEPPAYSDWANGADRPTIDANSYGFYVGTFHKFYNIIFEGDSALNIFMENYGVMYNCKFHNDSVTADRYGFYGGSSTSIVAVSCEFISDNGRAVYNTTGARWIFCYIHDSPNGIYGLGSYSTILFTIIDNCTLGIQSAGADYITAFGLTFYDCDTDIDDYSGQGFNWVGINNLHEGTNTDAIKWLTQTDINFWMYIHGDDTRCTDMWTNVATSGIHADQENTTGDPKFTTAGSDFSLASDSPCIDAGMAMALGVG